MKGARQTTPAVEKLITMNACEKALAWAREHGGSEEDLWRDCQVGSWMGWLVADQRFLHDHGSDAYRRVYAASLDVAALSRRWWFDPIVTRVYEKLLGGEKSHGLLARFEQDIETCLSSDHACERWLRFFYQPGIDHVVGVVPTLVFSSEVKFDLEVLVRDESIEAVAALIVGCFSVLEAVIEKQQRALAPAIVLACVYGDEQRCLGFERELSEAKRVMAASGGRFTSDALMAAVEAYQARVADIIRQRIPTLASVIGDRSFDDRRYGP